MNKVSSTGIRYLIRQGDRYVIKRFIDGAYVHYASFTDFEEAKEYLEYVKENNWSLSCKKKSYRKRGGELYCINNPRKGVYQVTKAVDGKHRQYASFKTLDEAKKYRDYCVEHNWSKDCILRRRGYNKYGLPKYITWNARQERYVIIKHEKGELKYCSFHKDLDNAIKERDLMVLYDWDEEKLMEHDEAFGSIWR